MEKYSGIPVETEGTYQWIEELLENAGFKRVKEKEMKWGTPHDIWHSDTLEVETHIGRGDGRQYWIIRDMTDKKRFEMGLTELEQGVDEWGSAPKLKDVLPKYLGKK